MPLLTAQHKPLLTELAAQEATWPSARLAQLLPLRPPLATGSTKLGGGLDAHCPAPLWLMIKTRACVVVMVMVQHCMTTILKSPQWVVLTGGMRPQMWKLPLPGSSSVEELCWQVLRRCP